MDLFFGSQPLLLWNQQKQESVMVLWCYNPYCLLQSCSASQTLKTLLSKAQVDPRTSKLAALLHQREHLIDGDLTANLSCGSLMSTVQKSLDENWQVCIMGEKTKIEMEYFGNCIKKNKKTRFYSYEWKEIWVKWQ